MHVLRKALCLMGIFSFSAVAEVKNNIGTSEELSTTAVVAPDKQGLRYAVPTDTQGRSLVPGQTYEVYATYVCSGVTTQKPITWRVSGGGGVFSYTWSTHWSATQRSVVYLSRMQADNRMEFFDRIKTPYTILGLGPYNYVYSSRDHWFVAYQKPYGGNPNYYAFGVQGKSYWLGVKCSDGMLVQEYDYTKDATWFSFERL